MGKGTTQTSTVVSSSVVSISERAMRLQARDTAAPKVAQFSPTDNAKNVSITANIVVKFSEAIVRGSGNIVLKDASGNTIESFDAANSRRISISGNTLKIDPTRSLENGTRYFVSFDQGIVTDKAGNGYKGSSSYDFTTVQEKKPPKVTQFFPRDGVKGVSPTQDIYVSFNEHIKAGKGSITVLDAKGKVVEKFNASSSRVTINGNILSINPAKDLKLDSKYTVKFDKSSITDLAGNAYQGTQSYDFKTAATNIAPTNPNWTPIPKPTTTPTSTPSSPAGGGGSGGGSGGGGSGGGTSSGFSITLDYSGVNASYRSYFDQAKALWENIITGDLADSGGIDDLRITATTSFQASGGVLGSAGPSTLRGGSNLPITGTMWFDEADIGTMINNGSFMRVVAHEMGHVLGLDTLWSTFGFLASAGTPGGTNYGQYTGAKGLAAYKAMSGGDPAATFVPVENDGGAGTAGGHWEESIFNSELMTGYSEGNGNMPLSILTVAALEDLGYVVNRGAAEAYGVGNIMAGFTATA